MKNIIKKVILGLEKICLSNKKRKDVLFVVANEVMFSYSLPLYQRLREDERLRIWFCFFSPEKFQRGKIRRVKSIYSLRTVKYRIAEYLRWDLIIYPDHGPYFRRCCKKAYTGHGLNFGKLVDGEPYRFGSRSKDDAGNIVYDRITLSGNNEYEVVKRRYPEFLPNVSVVGSLKVDEMLENPGDRKIILADMEFDQRRQTIMLISSWGPFSLAQNFGEKVIKLIRDLLVNYNVIVTIHQNNYVKKYSPEINWESLFGNIHEENLFIIRDREDPYKYLPCADCLITDFTSLALYYTFLARPILFYKNNDMTYEPEALTLELEKAAYVFTTFDDFHGKIIDAMRTYDKNRLQALSEKACVNQKVSWPFYQKEFNALLGF